MSVAPRRTRRRGSVIVPVLIVLVLLAYLAAEVGKDLAADYGGGAYMRGALASGGLLDAAEALGLRALARDAAGAVKVDSYLESWAEFGKDLDKLESADGPDLSGHIIDMCGLFPVNMLLSDNSPKAAVRDQYDVVFLRLLKGLQDVYRVEGDPKVFLNSLRYWMGDITATTDDGDWYGRQDPPYERPERGLLYPAELLLVHWEDVEDEDFRKVMLGVGEGPGLVDLVTVWGQGRINMNTAPEPIVRAVCPDSGKARVYWARVLKYRSARSSNLAQPEWYVKEAKAAGIKPEGFPEDCLGVTSDVFAVHVQSRQGATVRRQMSVVVRGDDKEQNVVFRQSY